MRPPFLGETFFEEKGSETAKQTRPNLFQKPFQTMNHKEGFPAPRVGTILDILFGCKINENRKCPGFLHGRNNYECKYPLIKGLLDVSFR